MKENIKSLIPKSKHDFESIEKLEKIPVSELEPILGDLLEWVQDMNWPICGRLEDLLATVDAKILAPYIQTILNGEDFIWKTNIVRHMVLYNRELYNELKEAIKDMAELSRSEPNINDDNEAAREVILKYEGKL